jgi:hypothetical protein
MDDWTPQIFAEGGAWAEAECLGSRAVVKVRASLSLLQTIQAAEPTFRRIPKDRLDDPLSSLTQAQKRNLRDWIEECGYPREEWQTKLGADLGAFTVRQVLNFLLQRRLKPRWTGSAIAVDGPIQPTRPLADVDAAVAEG